MTQVMYTKKNHRIIHREVNQAMKNVALNYKSLLINEKEEFLILRLYIFNNLILLMKLILNAFRLFIKVVQFAGPLRSDMGAV